MNEECFIWWKKNSCHSSFSMVTKCEKVQKFIKGFKKEFPEVILVEKRYIWWCRLVDFLLKVLSSNRIEYVETITTTFKNKIYLSDFCSKNLQSKKSTNQLLGVCTLRHEVVHLKQFRLLGTLKFLFLYSWPLFYRTRRATFIELPAYLESMRALFEYFGKESIDDNYIKKLVCVFTGPEYLWMYTNEKLVKSWFEEFRKGLIK